MSDINDSSSPERPSKSQRKRDMTALQKLGEILVNLPAPQLAKIPLEGSLAEAVATARILKSREGLRRQLQYIGRLMRNIDAGPIEEALAVVQSKDQQGKARFHLTERWRDKLIAEGDKQLEEFLNKYPQADHQHLRQLVRKAHSDSATVKKSGADTELFRYLRQIIDPS